MKFLKYGIVFVMSWFFLLTLGLTPSNAATSQPTVKITLPTKVAPTNPRTISLKRFGKLVNKFSGGKIKVTVYPGGELYNTPSGIRALTQGAVQMMESPSDAYLPYGKLFGLIEIPFIFGNSHEFYSFLYGKTGDKILNSIRKSNIEGITFADEGPMIIATKNGVLTKPADFKGLVVRTSGHPMVEAALKLLGASTVKMDLGEVYSAAQQGVVSGVYTTLDAYMAQHLYEVLPDITLWPGRGAYMWVASKTWWDSLDSLDRYILSTTAKQVALEYDYNAWHNKDKYVNELLKKGAKYHEFTEAQLKVIRLKIEPLYSKLGKQFGPIVNKIISKY